MHRIDGPGATEDGRFTDGNPAAGIPPTIVTDDWANAVQEEIVGVIAGAGLALDKADNGQLLEAIAALIAAAAPELPHEASTDSSGLVELATNTETAALADSTRAITPSGLGTLFARLHSPAGYQRLPAGFTIQWGNALSSVSADVSVTFPIAYSEAAYHVFVTPRSQGTGGFATTHSLTPTGFQVGCWTASTARSATNLSWIAIGR